MKWPLVRLEQLAAQEPSSIKIGPFGSQLKKTELVASGIHVVGIENVISNIFDGLGDRYITEEKFSTLRFFQVKPGDVLLTMMGTVGEVAVVPQGTSTSIMDSHLLRFRPNSNLCSSEYIAWLLKGSASTRSVLHGRAHGAIMKGLNSSIVRSLPAPLPPLSEQLRLVEILDQADALRKKRAEADAKANLLLSALFIKMFGDPATNPMGWRKGRLGSVIDETQYGTSTRANTEGKGIAVIRMNSIDPLGRLDLNNLKHIVLDAQEVAKHKLEPGDLLFNRTNSKELVGKTGLWLGGIDAVPASYLIRVRVDRGHVLPEFIWAYMNTAYMKQVLFDKARRAIGMANINAHELRALPVVIPDLEAQRLFSRLLSDIDYLVGTLARTREKLDQLSQTLIRRAFSGELTATWREAHMKELLAEMEKQVKYLATRETCSQRENRALQESLF